LPREEFRQLKLILHSELRRRAASRRALPCPSSYFMAYERQRTLHGVAIITKLYIAIFAAFKESMTSNLAQTSSKVISLGTNGKNRKRAYIFALVVNSNLDPIWHRFRDTAAQMSKIANFPYPTLIPAKIWGCSLWSRSVMLDVGVCRERSG